MSSERRPAVVPDATAIAPRDPQAAGAAGQLIAAGAEMAELLERLVRRHSGMTLVQFRIVELLDARYPERLEPWQVGETLGLSSNHVSMLLDQLEARAAVKRHPHPHDGRRRLIEITKAGRTHAADASGVMADIEHRILASALGPDELAQLDHLLERVRAQAALLADTMRRRPGP